MSYEKKYLIIGPSWVGDMVMAQSLFIDIKQREPYSVIDVLAPAWTGALTDRMPQVNQLIDAGFKHGKLGLGERFRLAKSIKKQGYTHAIILPNSLKSALVPWLARIPKRAGFVGEQRWGVVNNIRKLNKALLPMTVQRFIALGLPKSAEPRAIADIPVPSLQVNPEQVDAVLEKNQLSSQLNLEQPCLVLCPGAEFGASKQWPAAYYAEVANHYLAQGWQVWLMGSNNDRQTCESINQLTQQQCQNLAGQTTLPEAIDLMSRAQLVVSNDSGLMHIAAALQIPLVAVYGSTDPGHTPPLSEQTKIARLGLECSPCFKRECPLEHLNCLKQLLPEQVIRDAEQMLG